MSYLIKLQVFEGPLDLLLHLIKKNEMDIYNIPIAEVTRQYLDYLSTLEKLDMEIASEFIVMAATLMYIKSKLLIPREVVNMEEEVSEDPRAPLVERLLEYQRFKEIAQKLAHHEALEGEYFSRPFDPALLEQKLEEAYIDLDLYALVKAFNQIMYLMNKEPQVREIILDDINVHFKMEELLNMMQYQNFLNFTQLFSQCQNRREIVATFLALLELVKSGRVLVQQVELFGEIRGYPAQLSLEVA